jgi:predicted metalloprotease with PDZ domain
MWVGEIAGPLGVTSWFSEGLNTYYTRLLPMRGGFDSVAAYARHVNDDFRAYYTSPARNLSADSIVTIGFNDEGVRHIPYLRGSFYFADLDSKIRAASHGRRTLDSLVIELFRRRARGERFDHAAWIAAVTREIGPSAKDEFERVILRGETIVPPSDAFGPCFARRESPASGYEWVRVESIPDVRCRVW